MRVGVFPAVAPVEDVFYALVGGELVDLRGPGGGEGAAVHVLQFALVAGFGYDGHVCVYIQIVCQ